MNTITLLQVSENVVRKSAEMAARDPHGLIITLVSVAVVFSALVILYFAYTFIGKAINGKIDFRRCFRSCRKASASDKCPSDEEAAAIALALDQELNGEAYAAIAMAMHQYLNDTVHDTESYIITIKRKHR
jgi:Na+-transporting methylmalonyl-CoA/oxaloacetate decarboxylase gamma subunit